MSEDKSRLSKFFHRSSADEKRPSNEFGSQEQSSASASEKHAESLAPPPFHDSGSYSPTSTQPHFASQHLPHPDSKSQSQSQSQQPPTYTPSRTQFASLSLHSHDKLRLLEFPNEIVDAVRATIKKCYEFGIQREDTNYGGSHEFKLASYPWNGQGKDAVPSRILIREILSTLYHEGWILLTGVDISRKEADCDTLLFRHEPLSPSSSPRRALDFLSISFNEYDKFRLIAAPSVLPLIQPLIPSISSLLKSLSLYSREEWKDKSRGAYQFKCAKYVWDASGEGTMRSRALLVALLGVLEEEGWALYGSVDQSTVQGTVSEIDTWYLVREREWVRGMKVWHR